MQMSKAIFVVGAKRTPFCKYGGNLRAHPAGHTFAAAAKEAMAFANVDPRTVDATIIGNVNYLSQCDGGKTPRYCGLFSGVPIDRPALGINKACGSGLQAIITSSVEILSGTATICLTGGTDIMSSLPYLIRNVRFETSLGVKYEMEGNIGNQSWDSHRGLFLSGVAEKLAKKYGVKQVDVDSFALQSHFKWRAAQEAGAFRNELANVTVTLKNKEYVIDEDELLKTEESNNLKDEGGLVSVRSSSLPADGAVAIILADEESLTRHNLQPLARIQSSSTVGVDPESEGTVAAVKSVLHKTGLTADDVDLFELNETFAAQTLVSIKELNIDPSKVNLDGGSLAVGHPVSATGSRMLAHLVYALRHHNLKRGVAASSCGTDQGVAIMVEKI